MSFFQHHHIITPLPKLRPTLAPTRDAPLNPKPTNTEPIDRCCSIWKRTTLTNHNPALAIHKIHPESQPTQIMSPPHKPPTPRVIGGCYPSLSRICQTTTFHVRKVGKQAETNTLKRSKPSMLPALRRWSRADQRLRLLSSAQPLEMHTLFSVRLSEMRCRFRSEFQQAAACHSLLSLSSPASPFQPFPTFSQHIA